MAVEDVREKLVEFGYNGLIIPELLPEDVVHLSELFKNTEMMLIAGSLPIIEGPYSDPLEKDHQLIQYTLSHNAHAIAELKNHPEDRMIGPYIINETYYPQGIAVWGLKNRIKTT